MGNWVGPGLGDVGSYQVAGQLYVVATDTANRTIALKFVPRAITVFSAGAVVLELYDNSDNKRSITLSAGTHRFEGKFQKFGLTNAAAAGTVVELTDIEIHHFVGRDFAELGSL